MTMRVWGRGRKRNIIKENIIHIIQRTIPWRFHASVTSLGFLWLHFFFMGRYSFKKYCICVSVCVSVFLLCTMYVLWVLWYCKVFAIFNVHSCQRKRDVVGWMWVCPWIQVNHHIHYVHYDSSFIQNTDKKVFTSSCGMVQTSFYKVLEPSAVHRFPFFYVIGFWEQAVCSERFLGL